MTTDTQPRTAFPMAHQRDEANAAAERATVEPRHDIPMAEYLDKMGITETAERLPIRTDGATWDNPNASHWRLTFRRYYKGRRTFTVEFSQGSAHDGKQPQADDVLDCIASDLGSFSDSRDIDEWAENLGIEKISEALRIYQQLQQQREQLEGFLDGGSLKIARTISNLDLLLWHVERL